MRDEVILPLDLYFRGDRSPTMEACAGVSSILWGIPVEREKAVDPAFRGPNSVRSKTQNFLGMDPATTETGRSNASRLDREVWDEFAADPIRLAATADAIGANIDSLDQAEAEVEEEEVTEAEEGAILTRVHRGRERNLRLRTTKIERVRDEMGRLVYEACDLDFGERYGE
jgi:5-methylcytosine-specific restriction enzyme A